ncbi:hypothetical protein BU17DRAFT_72691 [Hysterangium stoloniferum]|nr:hypothetical protein BU17DRAFT_72766 [Hysterangium stoloniferum]KAF8490730.1 hypothetical protein BU17DRAFT_72691 [Hysterangium stoloniferum]
MLAYLLRFSYQFTVYLRDYIMSNENGKFLFHRENGTFVDTRKATKISIIDASSCVSMDKNPDRITVERVEFNKMGLNFWGLRTMSHVMDSQAYPKPRKLTDGSTKTSRKPPPRSLTDISVDISIASSSQDASDELQFSPDGTTAFLEPWREFDTLEPLDLRGIREPFPLSKLVTLVKAVCLLRHNTEPMVLVRRIQSHTYIRAVVKPSKRKLGTCQLPILPYRQTIPMGTQGRKPEDVLQPFEKAWVVETREFGNIGRIFRGVEYWEMVSRSNKESEDRRKENERLKEENKRLEEMVENGRKRLEELRIVIHCWIIDDLPQQIAENERKEKKRIEEECIAFKRAYEEERNKNKSLRGYSSGCFYTTYVVLRIWYCESISINERCDRVDLNRLQNGAADFQRLLICFQSFLNDLKLGVWESVGLATGSPLVFIQVIGDFMKQTYVNQLAAISNSKVKLPVCGWLSDDREAVTSPFEAATPALFIAIPFLSGKSFKVYW